MLTQFSVSYWGERLKRELVPSVYTLAAMKGSSGCKDCFRISKVVVFRSMKSRGEVSDNTTVVRLHTNLQAAFPDQQFGDISHCKLLYFELYWQFGAIKCITETYAAVAGAAAVSTVDSNDARLVSNVPVFLAQAALGSFTGRRHSICENMNEDNCL